MNTPLNRPTPRFLQSHTRSRAQPSPRWIPLLLCLVATTSPGCDLDGLFGSLTFSPNYCADDDCDWVLFDDQQGQSTGQVTDVPTWHEAERGLSLDTQGTEVSVKLHNLQPCMTFRILVDADPDAHLEFRLDFDDDRSTESVHAIPPGRYVPHTIVQIVPERTEYLRVTLRKTGPGKAVTTRLHMVETATCPDDAFPAPLAPDGQRCIEDADCETGDCVITTVQAQPSDTAFWWTSSTTVAHCSNCAHDRTCQPGRRCAAQDHCDGAPCVNGTCGCRDNLDCPLGEFCTEGMCSPCAETSDCPGKEQCLYQNGFVQHARQCLTEPLVSGSLPDGALCNNDASCRGGTCGALDGLAPRCGVACGLGLKSIACPDDAQCTHIWPEGDPVFDTFIDDDMARLHQAALDIIGQDSIREDSLLTPYVVGLIAQPAVCQPNN